MATFSKVLIRQYAPKENCGIPIQALPLAEVSIYTIGKSLSCWKVTCCLSAVCGRPRPPSNGKIVMLNVESTELEYCCDPGLSPSGIIKSVFMDSENGREWVPNPAKEECHLPGIDCFSYSSW